MLIEDVKKLSVEERFIYWISEREQIRLYKERGVAQEEWTEDEILATYRFCNVRRMDDRVSQWLLNNWYTPNFDHKNMLLACTVARLFNLPEALEQIGFLEKKYKTFRKHLLRVTTKRKQQGLKNFNGAYIVSTNGLVGDKVDILVSRILDPISTAKIANRDGMEQTAKALLKYWGISTFLAGQITADLRWAVEGHWVDRCIWAFIGPGSRRGLNRLLGRPITASMSQAAFEDEFIAVRKLVEDELPGLYKRLEAIDIQSCLCEFDKYERTLWNEGKPKQRYRIHA